VEGGFPPIEVKSMNANHTDTNRIHPDGGQYAPMASAPTVRLQEGQLCATPIS
jgi:hypothetical protein